MTKLWTSDLKPILEDLEKTFDADPVAEVLRVLAREEARFASEGHPIPKGDTFGCGFWLMRARAFARLGKLADAIDAVTGVAESEDNQDVTRAKAHALRADLHARAGALDEAIWDARAAMELASVGSSRDEASELLPVLFARKRAPAKAAAALQAARAKNDTYGRVAVAEAEMRRVLGDAGGAETLLREVIAKRKQAAERAKLALVRLALAHGRADQALSQLAELPPSATDDVERLLLWADVLRAVGRSDEADEKQAKAVELRGAITWDPNQSLDAAQHLALGNEALAANDLVKAEHWAEILAELAPGEASTWVLLGRLRAAQGRLEQALDAFGRSPAGEASLGRGEMLLRLGRREEARSAFGDAVHADPTTRLAAGRALLDAGDAAGARFFLEAAARDAADDRRARMLFGRCSMALGDARAEALVQELLREAPDDGLRRALVAHHLQHGAFDAALTLAEQGTSESDALDAAAALIGLGRTSDAAAKLIERVDGVGEDAPVVDHARMAQMLVRAGEADDALAWLARELAAAPTDPTLHLAMQALHVAAGDDARADGWTRSANAYRLLHAGDAAQALAAFEAARASEPTADRHVLGEARALIALKKRSEAEKRYEAFVPSDERAWLEAYVPFLHEIKKPFEARKHERRLAELSAGAASSPAPASAVAPARPPRERPPRAAKPEKLKSLELAKRIDDGFAHEVLTTIEANTTGWDRDDRGQLVKARALVRLERWSEAVPLIEALENDPRAPASERGLVVLLGYRCHEGLSRDVEMRLRRGKAALAGYVSPDVKAELQALLALGYSELGVPAMAEPFLAELDGGSSKRLHRYTRGRLALAADDRIAARAAFEEAMNLPPRGPEKPTVAQRARAAFAHVAALLGEDDAARVALAACTPLDDDLDTRQAMADAYGVLGDVAQELALLDALLALSPKSALAEARTARRAALVAWSAPSTTRVLLPHVPGVVQKRAHCGPASLELLLAHFRQQLDQDAIARIVKTRGGTPTWAMRELLTGMGFVARRARMGLGGIEALLDRQVPVLLEEQYSQTQHVALAVGYDDALGQLAVRDPMSHRLRTTSYADVDKLRRACGDAVIVAVPAADAALIDGIVDAPELLALEEAERALSAADVTGALAALMRALAIDANLEPARFLQIRFAESKLRHHGAAAFDELEQLVAEARLRFPTSDWPEQHLAELRFAQNRFAEGIEAMGEALRRDPHDTRSLLWMGIGYERLGDTRAAELSYRQALWLEPAFAGANSLLAGVLATRGPSPEAWHRAEIAVRQQPHEVGPWLVLAELELATERPQDALESYDRALKIDARSITAICGRGRALLVMGKRDEAKRLFDEAIAMAPYPSAVRRDVAEAYFRAGDSDSAYAALVPVLDEPSLPPSVLAMAGAALAKKGDAAAAETLLARALALAPGYTFARIELTRTLLAQRRFDEALALAEAGLELVRGLEPHEVDRIAAFVGLGKKDHALAAVSALTTRVGARPDLYRTLADMLWGAGWIDEARVLIESAIDRSLDLDRPHIHLMLAYEKLLADAGELATAHTWSRAELAWRSLGRPEAVTLFDELRTREPAVLRHRLGRWRALEALGRGKEALDEAEAHARAENLMNNRVVRWHSLIALRTDLLSYHWCDLWTAAQTARPDDLELCEAYLQACVDFRERLEPFIDGLERRRYEIRRKLGLLDR